jgi:hypothetical protein
MRISLLFFCLLFAVSCCAQGHNNDQKIDQQDLLFLFRQSKLTPFKFYFSSKSDSACNIIIEQYLNGQLIKTRNFYEETKKIVAMTDEPKSYYYPPLNGKAKPIVRLYFDQTNPDTLRIFVKTENVEKRFSFPVSSTLLTESRAFDNISPILKSRQPLVAFYGNDAILLSCPGDAKPKEIAGMYKFVVIVYSEPLRP